MMHLRVNRIKQINYLKSSTHLSSLAYVGKVALIKLESMEDVGSAEIPCALCLICTPLFLLKTLWNLSRWLLRLAISSFFLFTLSSSSRIRISWNLFLFKYWNTKTFYSIKNQPSIE